MGKNLDLLGNVVGVAGIIVCTFAGASRLLGSHYLLGFESVTLFNGGMALMVMSCLVKLHQLTGILHEHK
jgi:hypothetical protein